MFHLQDGFTYWMPAHFGGEKFDAFYVPEFLATQRAAGLAISYETDREKLENYIPEGFELLTPEVHVLFSSYTAIKWLAGGYYNLINVAAPVRFHGKKDQLDGEYVLVTWENKTAPILRGREQTGIPKIYAHIEGLHTILAPVPEMNIPNPLYSTTASYEGSTFFTMSFEPAGPISGDELDNLKAQMVSMNMIGWRYIPKVGAPGAELNQFVLFPQGVDVETAQQGTGRLSWMEQTVTQNPVQCRIINSLASLPVKKVTQAVLTEGQGILRYADAKVIE